MSVTFTPIGHVSCTRSGLEHDHWDRETATIHLDPGVVTADSLAGLEEFSHIEVIFHFHQASPEQAETGARRPRGRADWPLLGVFAQRSKSRPNPIGATIVRVLSVDGLTVKVAGLDAIDGTPVLDLKPYIEGFGPRGEVRQPAWASELMEDYWED
ncbi:tRNA (N6-threonylcarbamoyladenosine(37)-N6)-methyltransferase TrmO [Demequina salsinemoris]|uniref:tRNA (N6-threonylcarbamoyladenosine(37)-N6)-methyltransferase TrmO n=1 Tax=Demequina salsinemoris TaxID=577470 RepID=UPI0007841FE6|nr:tRNA (N6-threonylcarbamoyladenosine(37)-N6)-methyltransferase TrmO [Demequina salsinemoris]